LQNHSGFASCPFTFASLKRNVAYDAASMQEDSLFLVLRHA